MSDFTSTFKGELQAFETWKAGKTLLYISRRWATEIDTARLAFIRIAGGPREFKALRDQGAGGGKRRNVPQGVSGGVTRSEVQTIATDIATEVVAKHVFAPETPLDLTEVRSMIQAELKKNPPVNGKLDVTINNDVKTKVTIAQSHSMLKEVLRRVGAGFGNVLCVGPAGSGKTTLASQLSQSLKRSFGFISLSGGTTEGQLLGRLSSTGVYLPSLFVQLYETGGVFLLDEVDAADANVLLVLNSALANGDLAVPARVKKPTAKRHKDFVLIAAANTWGSGADWQYVGRNQLDAAFLSRFAGAVIKVDYDEALESTLATPDWYADFIRVRHAASAAKVRRVLGTRELLAGQRLLNAGYERTEVWHALTQGWSVTEISQARIVS
jgi:cobaltochelatase CobS